jgi:hypothetical protein
MRVLGRRILSRLEEAQIFAAGDLHARLRRENKVLLDDIGELRGLYAVCLRDRERLQELLNEFTGTVRPQSLATAAHMYPVTK